MIMFPVSRGTPMGAATHSLMAPSCTMRYFPGPAKIKELIRASAIGSVLNINYQTGQYLRDWHPWEPIEDYYVSKRETGGCREIVPFELTWLNDVFGDPGLYVDFRDGRRALLFDFGDVSGLQPRKLLRISDIFISHTHVDHFAGFDRWLRVVLGRKEHASLTGGPGFIE